MPMTDKYQNLVKVLFCGQIDTNSRVMTSMVVVRGNSVKIGQNVVVMNNCLMMGAGGIVIDDDVRVAANVQLIPQFGVRIIKKIE